MKVYLSNHYGDETCSACVVAGETIYLAHHAGGFEKDDVAHQTREAFKSIAHTLKKVGADISDLVQITLYLKNKDDFRSARDVFKEYFSSNKAPARMSVFTQFLDDRCLCMIDGIAYKSNNNQQKEKT